MEAARLYASWYRFVTMWQAFKNNFAEAGIAEEQWSPLANAIAYLDDEFQTALVTIPEKRPIKMRRGIAYRRLHLNRAVVNLADQSGSFFVGKVKVHPREYRPRKA